MYGNVILWIQVQETIFSSKGKKESLIFYFFWEVESLILIEESKIQIRMPKIDMSQYQNKLPSKVQK